MSDILWVVICFIIVGIQHFLSTRNNAIFGVIIPTIYTVVLISVGFYLDKFTTPFFLGLFGGLVILLATWNSGRNYVKKKLEKEIEIMKTKDIK